MSDATETVETTEAASNKLGRNQKIAVAGYGAPLLGSLALCAWAMAKAPTVEAMIPVLDRWLGHALVYVPIAMGSILLVSGAIKSVEAVTDAVAKFRASKPQ